MEFKWFNRPSIYFNKYPELLRCVRTVTLFMDEMMELKESINESYSKSYLILAELDAEIKWLHENRQDNKVKFD